MKRYIYFSLYASFLFLSTILFAQKPITIQGRITDSATKSPLAYAGVRLTANDGTTFHAQTDTNGIYNIHVQKLGRYNYHIAYLGYSNNNGAFLAGRSDTTSGRYDVAVVNNGIALDEAVIIGKKDNYNYCCCSSRTYYTCGYYKFKDSIPQQNALNQPKWYSMNIFPNPTHNRVQIAASRATEAPVQLQVLDAAGRLVLRQEMDFRNQANYTFDLSAYRHGTYFFNMQYLGETHIEKIMKLH